MSYRQERVGEQIHRLLSELITFGSQDPRLAGVVVNRVVMSGDLRHATVYILYSGSPEEVQEALAGLARAQGFLRRQLAQHLKLRFTPELSFALDEQEEQDRRVQKLLDEIKQDGE